MFHGIESRSELGFFLPLARAQEIREKVKALLQLADSLLSSGANVHAPAISHWADAVDLKYKDFNNRTDQLKYARLLFLSSASALVFGCCPRWTHRAFYGSREIGT